MDLPPGAVKRVVDGDTFEADLNGDGRWTLPAERVRMLYVDTPELHESHKGKDVKHGEPARRFLEQKLLNPSWPLRMEITGTDGYGRALALVWKGKENLNLALVALGHSPVDTRFGFPPDYPGYLRAEAGAFEGKRGIWGDERSRTAYLQRLKKEGRTPLAPSNPLFAAPPQGGEGWLNLGHSPLSGLVGRFVRMRGEVLSLRMRGKTPEKQVLTLVLMGGPDGERVNGVVFPRQLRLLIPTSNRQSPLKKVDPEVFWPPGTSLEMEGFVQKYKGNSEIAVHFLRKTERKP
ncbi:MAG: thermonuclease family protein [Deltaproteobacteria bacterium]|nr:thermonuclease family protein [Deltaproteobacteria bacterium]